MMKNLVYMRIIGPDEDFQLANAETYKQKVNEYDAKVTSFIEALNECKNKKSAHVFVGMIAEIDKTLVAMKEGLEKAETLVGELLIKNDVVHTLPCNDMYKTIESIISEVEEIDIRKVRVKAEFYEMTINEFEAHLTLLKKRADGVVEKIDKMTEDADGT